MTKILQKLYKSKFVACLILFSQIVYALPAQAIIQEKDLGKMRLEQYLSWADRQKEAEDWERLAEEGVLAAMSEWESANAYLKETNYEEYLVNKNEAYEEFESIKSVEYTYWYMNKRVQEEAALKRSELAQNLAEKSAEYKELYAESGARKEEAAQAEREWDEYATALVNQYMNNLMASDESLFPEIEGKLKEQKLSEEELKFIYSAISGNYEQTVLNEYGRIYAAEKNQLMSVLLYDTKSTKMLSSAQAAEVIAKDTAKTVKGETDLAMNELFGQFEETIEGVDEDDIQIKRENWLNNFQKSFEESVQKWNEAEMEFLAKRSEWESQGAEIYDENERAWAEGYRLLQQKRTEWFKEIEEKLENGRKEWDQSERDLNDQLEKNYKELQATLEKERDSKEKNIDLYVTIYNQSRSMLNIVAAGLEGAGNSIIESYGNNYAYWKTEAADSPDSDTKQKITELFDIFNNLRATDKNRGEFFNDNNEIQKLITLINELSPTCNNTELKSELEALVAEDGWLTYLVNYKAKTLDAVEKLYKLTGCIYKGDAKYNEQNTDPVYFNELDYEIVKAKITLEYWQEEYEVVNAVREYAESLDSTTETDTATTQELLNKTAMYEQALAAYEEEVKTLVSCKNNVESAQKNVDEKKKILDEKKKALEDANKEYSELLVVYRGAGTEPIKNKLYSLIVEYENKKSKSNEDEFEEYYKAAVEYNNENMKQKYYSAKNNIINGSEGLLPKARLESYKDEVNGFITSLDIDADSNTSLIKNYANKIAQYCGDESYYIKKYLEEYTRLKEEEPEFSEQKKAEYKSIISKYLQSVEKYFENEINQREEALYYIEHGKFENNAAELSDFQKKATEVKNYLTAVLNAKKEWTDTVKADLSEYDELFAKVSELSGKSGEALINAVKEEVKNNEQFRLLMQQNNVFGSDLLMIWIKQESDILNKNVFNAEDNQTIIKDSYSQYAVNAVNANHANSVQEINNYLKALELKSLTGETVYSVIEKLRAYEKNLNEYGIAAIENYITSLTDVVATNEVNKNLSESDIKTIENERDAKMEELNQVNVQLSSLQVLANTGLSDVKTVIEKMDMKKENIQDYTVYLMMAYLYQSDLEDCKNKDDVKAIFKKALDKVKADAEESASIITDETSKAEKINELVEASWYNSFDKLEESIKNKLCQKIYDVYNFDETAESYQKYAGAINDYFTYLNDEDLFELNFVAGEQPEERKAIAEADTFVNDYFALQDLLKQCDGQIEHLREELNTYTGAERNVTELNEQIAEIEEQKKLQPMHLKKIFLKKQKLIIGMIL